MTVNELLKQTQFLVDDKGNKKAVVFDYALWKDVLTLLEDQEDSEEIRTLRESEEDVITWEQAKDELRGAGVDV